MSINSLSFPLVQHSDEVLLNYAYLINKEDSARYRFDILNCKCTSISKIDTKSMNVINEQFSYIDNYSSNSVTPLLIRCNSSYNKMKLNMTFKSKEPTSKSLVIVKTNLDQDINTLLSENKKSLDISQISYLNLPSGNNVTVNDVFDSVKFKNGVLHVYLFEVTNDKYSPLLTFSIWLDKPEETVEEPENYKVLISDYKNAFNFVLDDGPEFRKNLSKYEVMIPAIQKNINELIDELKATESNAKKLINNKKRIIDMIGNISAASPILGKFNFKQNFKYKMNRIFEPIEVNLKVFINTICDQKLLVKIKGTLAYDEKSEKNEYKKSFEHNSKDFYNWLKKYLSNEKERPELKLLTKRKAFELSKVDYVNHLNSYLNNQYINRLIESLLKFLSIQPGAVDKDFDLSKVELNSYYQVYLDALSKFNTEKFKLRQMIETAKSNKELTEIIKCNNLTADPYFKENIVLTKSNMNLLFAPESGDPEDSASSNENEKSGILYTLGGKGKQGWHKEWVVVKDGELKEYSDWRNGADPINTPIQIALSNVKPTNVDKRQNCFEIFTSTGHKFVFQAINEQERKDWIKTLENNRLNTTNLKKPELNVEKPTSISVKQDINSPTFMKANAQLSTDYYKLVRSAKDSDNHICVDCGSTESVEWVSINFLVVLCINCSSFHRNMGSHISKVRSLKLDTFDKETQILLSYINNRTQNSILEKNLKVDKTQITDNTERLQFIQNKYKYRKFVEEVPNKNEQLLAAIKLIDITNTIKYLLCGADVNLKIQLKNAGAKISLFEYSLRKFLTTDDGGKFFVILQLLVISGCQVNNINKSLQLSDEAYDFWNEKLNKLA